jgi:hypothetical protein
MEVSGYTLSAATLTSLGKLDFTSLPPPHAPDMFVIDGASMPVTSRWAESLLLMRADLPARSLRASRLRAGVYERLARWCVSRSDLDMFTHQKTHRERRRLLPQMTESRAATTC